GRDEGGTEKREHGADAAAFSVERPFGRLQDAKLAWKGVLGAQHHRLGYDCFNELRQSARLGDEDGPRQAERDALAAAFDPDVDRALKLAAGHNHDARSGHQAAALELAQLDRVVVGDPLDRDLLARTAFAERAVADGRQLAGERRDGMAVGVELRPAQQLEDALLHPLRDHVLEALRLVVDLVPAVAEHADQKDLQQAVVADQLQGDFAAVRGELLAAVAVVFDQALGGQAGDHLADARRRDAEALGEVPGRDRPAVAAEQVEGFEVVLLSPGEQAAALELLDHRA